MTTPICENSGKEFSEALVQFCWIDRGDPNYPVRTVSQCNSCGMNGVVLRPNADGTMRKHKEARFGHGWTNWVNQTR